jgi:hypothetical protein
MTLHLTQGPITTHTIIKYVATFSTLTALSFTPVSFAEIYRWADAQGKTHFSEHPPEGQVPSEEISSQLSPLNRDSSTDETKKLKQLFKEASPEEQAHQQQEKAIQQQQDQKMAQACNKARQQLKTITGRVFFVDDNGKEVIVTEEERQQRAQRLEREIRRRCS